MQGRALLLSMLIVTFLAGTANAQTSGNATLPLEDLLSLHASSTPKEEAPPTQAAVRSVVIKSRLLRGALLMTAEIQLSVLANNWVRVPLFAKNRGLIISDVSNIDGGLVVIEDDLVIFVGEEKGDYSFSVGLQQKAVHSKGIWRAQVRSFPATVLRMELQHDNTSFDVVQDSFEVDGDSLTLLPQNGLFTVSWKEKQERTEPVKLESRPKIQPVIEEAFADIVSTLDGQRISRYRYNLLMQGSQELTLSIPNEQNVTKVFLNGVSIPFTVEDGILVIGVAPPQVGGESATLELATQTDTLPYSLSGQLSFVLPRASWDLNEQYVTLHLPNVFNYARKGGSLGLCDASASTSFVYKIPTPGKLVRARQQLVTQTPHLTLQYTVDLQGKYYRGYDWPAQQEPGAPKDGL